MHHTKKKLVASIDALLKIEAATGLPTTLGYFLILLAASWQPTSKLRHLSICSILSLRNPVLRGCAD
jgi:hypothetical protein